MDYNKLCEQLKAEIIERLSLTDLTPADIGNDDLLFDPQGVGLDSIDAIEIVLIIEKSYGIKVEDPRSRRDILASVGSIAKFIINNSPSLSGRES